MPEQKPLLERLARRYATALTMARSGDWKARVRADNRISHVMREAERADITYDNITAEATRLGLI